MTSSALGLDELLNRFTRRSPAPDTVIGETEKSLTAKLPKDYVAFLKLSNGGEGFINKEYLTLWPVEELVSMNGNYEVEEYAPGLLIFGSNGGGEAYGFDTRTPQWPIVMVPFIPMRWDDARRIEPSFRAFLERLYRTN